MYNLTDEIEKAQKAIVGSISRDSEAVRDLREYNHKQILSDPAKVAWPATLPIELALKTASPQELKVHYSYSDEDWDALRLNPTFLAEVTSAIDLVKQEGMSFRLKARLQSEALLETQWRLIHGPNSEVPAAVKQRGIETMFRVAGFDNKEAAGAGTGNQLAIQINFSGGQPSIESRTG